MDPEFKDRFSIIQVKPSVTASPEAAALYNQGTALLLRGQFQQAINPLTLAAAADPSWADPYLNLSLAYSHLGGLEEAQLNAKRAIAISPTSSAAHNNLGTILLRWKKNEPALEEFRIAHELDPFNISPLANSAVICRRLKQHAKAIEFNLKVLALDPERTKAHHNLSIAYWDMGDIHKAVQSEIKALRTVPEKKRHYIYLANLLLHLVKRKCAVSFLQKEIRSFPSDADPHVFLATIYLDNYWRDPENVELSPVKKELKAYLSIAGESGSAARNTLNLIRAWQIGSFFLMEPIQWENIFQPGKLVGGILIAAFWNMIIRSLLLVPSYFYSTRSQEKRFQILLKSSISESELIEKA